MLALTDGTTVYYYGLDGHGSVANLTDKNGAVVNMYRYDPYGNSLSKSETASIPNPWQYAGGYYDAESGLYLLGARYYAPTLGRFLQQDPLGSSGSQYAYAGSNPCNNSDPTGSRTCYHHVTPSEVSDQVWFLQDDSTNLTIIGTVELAAAGAAALVPGLQIPAAAGIVIGSALIIGGQIDAKEALALQPYATTGFDVQYNSYAVSLFGFGLGDGPCHLNDSTSPSAHSPVVSGVPFYGGPFCQDTGEGHFKVETSPFFRRLAGLCGASLACQVATGAT